MNNIIKFTIIIILFSIMQYHKEHIVYAEIEYAKWGKLAMEMTKERYPNSQIVDYLHIGRERKNRNSIEKFKLWLKKDGKEFGVLVDIEFNTKTEKMVNITFKEV